MTMHVAFALALALAATTKTKSTQKKDAGSDAAMSAALKSSIAVDPSPTTGADGGTVEAAPTRPGPDVSKMLFTPESVKTVVAFFQPQIQECYEQTLASKDKDVQGVLKTQWVVNPDGIVKSAKIIKKGTTLNDPKLHECVTTVIQTHDVPQDF